MNNTIFSISEGSKFIIKFTDGTIINLLCNSSEITCRGCGAIGLSGSANQGINVFYEMNHEHLKLMAENNIEKYRFYTNDGYVEIELKERDAIEFRELAELLFKN